MQDNHEQQELALRESVAVFVNSFEQLTYLRDTINWFHGNGFRNLTVLEQGSIYPPLRAYLASPEFLSKARLRELRKNVGPRRAVRKSAVLAGMGKPFIFTDPDLDLPAPIATDFLTRLFDLGRRYAVPKVGLALDVSENGKNDPQAKVGRNQTIGSLSGSQNGDELEPSVCRARIDTTFFLHVPQPELENFGILKTQHRISAVRVGGAGFAAGHRPWYFANGMEADEEKHYRARATIASTTFGRTR